MQSSKALEFVESSESLDRGDSTPYAAHKRVSLRLDLGIVDDDLLFDQPGVTRGQRTSPRDAVQGDLSHQFHEEALTGKRQLRRSSYDPIAGANVGDRCECGTHSAGVAEDLGLVHDTGNLLSALSLYSELLAVPGVLHEDYREYATELRQLSERSSAMISRLFDHVRQAKAVTRSRPTSLAEVIARCGGLLNRIAGRRVDISFSRGAERLVEISSEIVERIVINLVKNAAEAIGDDDAGSISVYVDEAGDGQEARVAVTVSDTGRGMTRAELAALCDYRDFLRGCHGVGLRVVRELAAMSNGCVAIASAPGEGTRVSVEWPSIKQIQIEVGVSTKRVVRGEAGWIAC